MRGNLPAGTVTLFFSDVEGSTRLLARLGPKRYAEALALQRDVVRTAVAEFDGVEVDTEGDGFFCAFPTAPGALGAARAVTERLAAAAWPAGEDLRIRVGLHTGTPSVAETGYVGLDVHRAARVMAAAHGGQVVLSEQTAALVDGAELMSLGRHRLKDFDDPVELSQLGTATFPPLRAERSFRLPRAATPFLGREKELYEAARVWEQSEPRVITVVGPGGTGKTRFALELARLFGDELPGGCVFVPLAALRDSQIAVRAVVQSLDLAEAAAGQPDAVIAHAVGERPTLLVLDNVEQLLPDFAQAVARLLDAASGLRLLVTSRAPLHIRAEHVFDLDPLSAGDAVELFAARCGAAGAPVDPDDPVVGALCERLDRLPLALELAAARARLLTPAQLLERIGTRLDTLKGAHDLDPRQRTLRATVEWSYGLLGPEEQRLFRSFGIFVDGCTLEAAEEICGVDIDVLEALVDHSLVRRREGRAGPRFWMLVTLRDVATALLDASGERSELAARHRSYFAREGRARATALRRWEPGAVAFAGDEFGNARAATVSAIDADDAASAAGLIVGWWMWWTLQGLARDGARVCMRFLDECSWGELGVAARYDGLVSASEILRFGGELERSREAKKEAIGLSEEHPDAICLFDRTLAQVIVALYSDLADTYTVEGDFDTARELLDQALARAERDGLEPGRALASLSSLEFAVGRVREADVVLERAMEHYRRGGYRLDLAYFDLDRARIRARLGDVAGAAALLAGAIPDIRAVGDASGIPWVARVGAELAHLDEAHEHAAVLVGAQQAYDEVQGTIVGVADRAATESVLAGVRAALGDASDELIRRGSTLDEEGVVDLVQQVARDLAP